LTATTDAGGVARFESLLEGAYIVSVDRALSAAERAALPDTDRDVSIFAGAGRVTVSPPTPSTTVELVASRRGSLVLSEISHSSRGGVPGGTSSAQYVEFFNASDTTIYMDGMLYFQTSLNLHRAVLDQYDCDVHNAVQRLDPEAVWALLIARFPGSGRDFPVAPGSAVLLANDATDHRLIHPDLQDLRGAHFEFIGGPADPDNPGAANMIQFRSAAPAGTNITAGTLVGIALPIARDTNDLEKAFIFNTSSQSGALSRVFRLPASSILDLGAFAVTPQLEQLLSGETCEPFTHPVFDRAPARLVSNDIAPIARKSLGFTETGIEILQRTRTSERDFAYTSSPLRRSLRRQ
jgi:hypothetical protein